MPAPRPREHAVPRPQRGAALLLSVVGAPTAVAGCVMYVLPGPGLLLLATGALLLSGAAGLWLISRRRG